MTKFQFTFARIPVLLERKDEFSDFVTNLILCVVFSFALLLVVIGSFFYEKYGPISFFMAFLSLMGVLLLIGVWSALTYNWAIKVFNRHFGFQPDPRNENRVLLSLKEVALELEKAFEGSKDIEITKKRFWSKWRVAKVFGFPVFKSWKTHAYSKFHF